MIYRFLQYNWFFICSIFLSLLSLSFYVTHTSKKIHTHTQAKKYRHTHTQACNETRRERERRETVFPSNLKKWWLDLLRRWIATHKKVKDVIDVKTQLKYLENIGIIIFIWFLLWWMIQRFSKAIKLRYGRVVNHTWGPTFESHSKLISWEN